MARKTNCTVNGVPKYRYRPVDPECDKTNFYGDSKKDAIRKYEEYMASKKATVTRGFINLFEDWLEVEKKPSLKLASYNRYLSIKSNWIDTAPYANHPITSIDSLMLKKHLNTIEVEGSKSTAHRVYLLLSSFFKYATDYHIDKNPMNRVSEPKYVPAKSKEYLTPSEIALVESKLYSPQDFIFIFALYTGMREGEIIALRVSDVNLRTKTISVTKTLNRVKKDGINQIVEGPPKTKAGYRELPIKDSLMPLIAQHIFVEKSKYSKFKLDYGPSSYFFTTKTGKVHRGDRLNDEWKLIQARLGLDPIKFHGLRHTYCTILARSRVRLEVASEIMGHDKIETTANVYIHVSKEDKKEAVEAINSIPSGDKMAK